MNLTKINLKEKPGKGHNVSHSAVKTNRKFSRNKQIITYFSNVLHQSVRLRASCKTKKNIDRCGTIDAYLIINKNNICDSLKNLRLKIIKKIHNK